MDEKKILVIEPQASDYSISEKLKNWGYVTISTPSHLYALKILDDEAPELIISSSQKSDINGIEFCKLVRFREKNNIMDKKYIILMLSQDELSSLELGRYDVDDIVVLPLKDEELKWRVESGYHRLKKIKKLESLLQLDPSTGVLNQNGIKSFLKKEISRAIRATGEISILLIRLNDLESIKADYGDDWARWLEEVYINHLKPKIRNFEGIGKLTSGVYCIITISTLEEVKGLANRIKREHEKFLLEHEPLKNLPPFKIEIRGVNITLELYPYQIEKIIGFIIKFLQNSLEKDQWEESFIKVKITENGITLLE